VIEGTRLKLTVACDRALYGTMSRTKASDYILLLP